MGESWDGVTTNIDNAKLLGIVETSALLIGKISYTKLPLVDLELTAGYEMFKNPDNVIGSHSGMMFNLKFLLNR